MQDGGPVARAGAIAWYWQNTFFLFGGEVTKHNIIKK